MIYFLIQISSNAAAAVRGSEDNQMKVPLCTQQKGRIIKVCWRKAWRKCIKYRNGKFENKCNQVQMLITENMQIQVQVQT